MRSFRALGLLWVVAFWLGLMGFGGTASANVMDLTTEQSATPVPYTPGQSLTYMVTVTNEGPQAADSVTVSDPLPSQLASAGFTWTCTANTGSSCTASGSGYIDDTVDIVENGSLTYTFAGTVPANATGMLTNTDTVTPPSGATDSGCDPNCSATSSDPQAAPGLSVTNFVESSGAYDAVGQTIDYQYVVTNFGNVTLGSVGVSDVFATPAGSLTSGPSCQELASPSGSCSGSSTSLAAGQSATFTGSYTITQADLNNGSVDSAAIASGEAPGCSQSSCATTSKPSTAMVAMTQAPGVGVVESVTSSGPYETVGQTIDYQYVVTNAGNVTLGSVGVSDALGAPGGPLTSG
ncbi:MAG: DUF7507 domain-containing protein, partial [Solirubrobacteraceae bacterium]